MSFSLEPPRFAFPTRWTASWIGAPSIPGDWRDPPPSLARELVDRIDLSVLEATGGSFTDRHPVERVRIRRASFYPDHLLVEIQVAASPRTGDRAAIAAFVYGPEGATLLDGASPPIHDLNTRHTALAEPAARLDYVRFFCAHVRGEAGPFQVVESTTDVAFRPRVRKTTRERVHALLEPLREDRPTKEPLTALAGKRRFAAHVLYDDVLFRTFFAVTSATGMIEMLDDEPLTGKLPLVAWTYDGNYRRPAAKSGAP